jgi:hypothetical protein
MKKLIFVLAVLLALPLAAQAQDLSIIDTLKELPDTKQGVAFSLIDSKLNYLTTIELINFKGFSLNAGYAGIAKKTSNKLVAVIDYDLLNLKEMGIDVPILDLMDIRPGLYAGFGRISLGGNTMDGNNEFDFGASVSIIEVKF